MKDNYKPVIIGLHEATNLKRKIKSGISEIYSN